MLLSQATFKMNDFVELVDSGKVDKQGKAITYQKRTHIDQQDLVNYEPEP